MTDIEELLRQALSERESKVSPQRGLVRQTRARVRKRHLRLARLSGLAGLLTLIVAVTVIANTGGSGTSTLRVATPAGPAIPAGSQPVSFHGLQSP